jgi:hypothetical protein
MGTHLDFIHMFDKDVTVNYYDAIIFFKLWTGEEPKQLIDFKTQLTAKGRMWVQLEGQALTEQAIAEANLIQSLRGLSDNETITQF